MTKVANIFLWFEPYFDLKWSTQSDTDIDNPCNTVSSFPAGRAAYSGIQFLLHWTASDKLLPSCVAVGPQVVKE